MGKELYVSQYFVNHLIYSGVLIMVIALLIFCLSYFLMTQAFEEESLEKLSAYVMWVYSFFKIHDLIDIRFYIVVFYLLYLISN